MGTSVMSLVGAMKRLPWIRRVGGRLSKSFPGLRRQAPQRVLPPNHDELVQVRTFDPVPGESESNRTLNEQFLASPEPVRTCNWLVPNFENVRYGGVYTLLRFADRMAERGVETNIIFYDAPPEGVAKAKLALAAEFPRLASRVLEVPYSTIGEVPPADVCVATFWPSAYAVSRIRNCRSKFYFIQDYEPLFYPAGTTYGLVENTYELGLLRLVNTPGLLAYVEQMHGPGGFAFVPTVDRSEYRLGSQESKSADDPVRIFFYGRPNHPRNGFTLGLEALSRVKARLGDRVDIVTAGDAWEPADFGVSGVVRNLGNLRSIREVAEVYRSVDIGLTFMFTRHPSYQPLEHMVSGCAVVSNRNVSTEWILKDGRNCLLAAPTIADVSEKLVRLVEDRELRLRLRGQGRDAVPSRTWADTIDDTLSSAGIRCPAGGD